MHPDIRLEPEPEWKKCPQCGRENSVATWQKFDGKCPNCGDLYDRDAGTAPSSVTPPQGKYWSAEDYRRASDVHETAERIIRRVVANALGLAHVRHNLDELTERQALIDDGLGVALGEDTGCLDPEDLSPENCEILYVEKELHELSARASSPSSATEPQNEWISVDEKLPAANWYGLFITNENYIELGSFRDDPDEKPCWVCERTAPQDETIKYVNQDGQVTHWRELPKPPSSALSALSYEPSTDKWHKCILEVRRFFNDYYDSTMPGEAFDDELRNVIRVTLLRAGAESGVPLEETEK